MTTLTIGMRARQMASVTVNQAGRAMTAASLPHPHPPPALPAALLLLSAAATVPAILSQSSVPATRATSLLTAKRRLHRLLQRALQEGTLLQCVAHMELATIVLASVAVLPVLLVTIATHL